MYRKVNYLSEDVKAVRTEVFIQEQGFGEEFDEIDHTAVHLLFYDKGVPMAVCRYYPGENKGEFLIGRVAIRKAYRKRQLGRRLMEAAEECIKADGGEKISLSAQLRVKGFYESCGYRASGAVYLDEGCEHILMEKNLNSLNERNI